ncbi:MAG: hypothetical protein K9G09_00120 [Pontimonas sp.]|nr:hypothetical protein [Pontimonas sp.]
MSKNATTEWIDLLGRPSTWSIWGLIVATIVATIVFAFGNLMLVRSQPLVSLVANTFLTLAVFAVLAFAARGVSGRLSQPLAGAGIGVLLLGLSALRGYGLDWAIGLAGIDDNLTAEFRAVVSVSVFAPGLVLSVLVVGLVGEWRRNQAAIVSLSDARERTVETVESAIDAYASELAGWVRGEIEPRLRLIPSLGTTQARQSLKDIVNSVVRPLSNSLQNPRGDLVAAPKPGTVRVALRAFVTLALQSAPLAPGLTGLIFGLTLLPRNLTAGTLLEGLAATIVLSLVIGFGATGINVVSRRIFRTLSGWTHVTLIGLGLGALGSVIAVMSQLLTSSSLGFDNIFLVGVAATLTLSVLLGGVVNGARYVARQREEIAQLESDVERELSVARRLQWQRHRALGNMLHGPLQAALNAGSIRLSRARTAQDVSDTSNWLSEEVTRLLDQMPHLDNAGSDLRLTMQRIRDTWEGICDIEWNIDDAMVVSLTGDALAGSIADVMVEAVFNAIKHQSPDTVTVELVETVPGRIRLTVSHPGTLMLAARPGLGTQTFDSLTTSFSLREEDGQVIFDALFVR